MNHLTFWFWLLLWKSLLLSTKWNAHPKSETLRTEPNIQRMMSWKDSAVQFLFWQNWRQLSWLLWLGRFPVRACLCSQRLQSSGSFSLHINNTHGSVFSHLCTWKLRRISSAVDFMPIFLDFVPLSILCTSLHTGIFFKCSYNTIT